MGTMRILSITPTSAVIAVSMSLNGMRRSRIEPGRDSLRSVTDE